MPAYCGDHPPPYWRKAYNPLYQLSRTDIMICEGCYFFINLEVLAYEPVAGVRGQRGGLPGGLGGQTIWIENDT